MKRWFCLFLTALLAALAGCGGVGQVQQPDGKLQVVATIFPLYDFARELGGEEASVTMLLQPGAEVHSYEPTPQDILTIQNCDVFLYIGGESDEWVRNVLASVDTSNMQVVALMDCVQAQEESHEGIAEAGHDHREDEEETVEYDEHIWTSPRNAMRMAEKIAETFCTADADRAEHYRANAADYQAQLAALDTQLRELVSGAERNLLVFADRFPFLYLARDYGLTYYAAYPGCAQEAEPSAATVAFLIEKVKETDTHTVFYIELSNGLMADTIAEATGAQKLLLHSCQNVTRDEFERGESYLSLMRQNLRNLQTALN